jgi:large conductance mechanosensitive channel
MLKEFREFALRGNVVDMAIGIVIGGAFTPVVASLVDDLLLPPIGLLLGDTDFTNLFVTLAAGDPAGRRVAAPPCRQASSSRPRVRA